MEIRECERVDVEKKRVLEPIVVIIQRRLCSFHCPHLPLILFQGSVLSFDVIAITQEKVLLLSVGRKTLTLTAVLIRMS